MTKKKEPEQKNDVQEEVVMAYEPVTAISTQPKFTIEKLRQNCLELFGITASTFDGATYALNGEFSLSDMKNIICKWQKMEVK